MFESMEKLNSLTRTTIKIQLKDIKETKGLLEDEKYEKYKGYINALKDMEIITKKEYKFLYQIGRQMIRRYVYRWSREQIIKQRMSQNEDLKTK